MTVTTTAPDWLLQREFGLCPCGCIGKRRKGGFIAKTLTGSAALLRQVMFSDDTARAAGVMQRIDPRVKIASLLGLLIVASLLHTLTALGVFYLATLALGTTSALPLAFFIKRVWLFVPIFTGIVVIPATLSVVTPGHIVLTLWTHAGKDYGFTAQGLHAGGMIVLRVATSISLVVLLTATTTWTRLLAALRTIGLPRILVLIIGMAYRYIFLLLTSVEEMYAARRARTVGAQRHDRVARATIGATAGALLGKSHRLSEEVHQAMTARGYRGEARTLEQFRVSRIDLYYVLGAVGFAAIVLSGDILLGW